MSATDNAPGAAPETRVSHLALYEGAMCCPTGVCGPTVEPALLAIGEDLRWAESRGAKVSRYDLASNPDAFVASTKVTGLLQAFGEQALPALLVDGEIHSHGRYPSRDELAAALGAPTAQPAEAPQASGCGSGGCC